MDGAQGRGRIYSPPGKIVGERLSGCQRKILDSPGEIWYDNRAVKRFSLTGGFLSLENTPLDRALLLDFYGELLTEKQKEYCDLHWNEDYSLAEIAELGGLSRQGVWDILRRAETALRDMEEKTGIVRRHLDRLNEIAGIRQELLALLPDDDRSRAVLQRLDGLM
jgi:predicted DNA-binding protein YlxM (UPF0122 family)